MASFLEGQLTFSISDLTSLKKTSGLAWLAATDFMTKILPQTALLGNGILH